MTLQEEQRELERRRIRAALEQECGNVASAAKGLGATRDWLKGKLRVHADLAELAAQLRAQRLPSEKALRMAWAEHGTLDACAKALGMPRTTLWRALSRMRLGVARSATGR